MFDAAVHREECAAGPRRAAILREIADRDVARQRGDAVQQSCEALRSSGCGVHRVATWRAGSLASLTGASGGTASRRNAPPTTPENTGAATSPP